MFRNTTINTYSATTIRLNHKWSFVVNLLRPEKYLNTTRDGSQEKSLQERAVISGMSDTDTVTDDELSEAGPPPAKIKRLVSCVCACKKKKVNWLPFVWKTPHLNRRKLLFVRHGEYTRNQDEKLQVLSEKGRLQVEYAGNWLIRNYNPVDTIWHSELTRSSESAHIIAKFYPGVTVQSSKLLNEVVVNKDHRIEVIVAFASIGILHNCMHRNVTK